LKRQKGACSCPALALSVRGKKCPGASKAPEVRSGRRFCLHACHSGLDKNEKVARFAKMMGMEDEIF